MESNADEHGMNSAAKWEPHEHQDHQDHHARSGGGFPESVLDLLLQRTLSADVSPITNPQRSS